MALRTFLEMTFRHSVSNSTESIKYWWAATHRCVLILSLWYFNLLFYDELFNIQCTKCQVKNAQFGIFKLPALSKWENKPQIWYFLTVFALAKDRGKCFMWKLLMFGSSIVARMRTCSDLLVLTPRFWTVLGKLAFSLKVFFVINLCIVYSKVSPLGAAFYPLLCAALTLSFAGCRFKEECALKSPY